MAGTQALIPGTAWSPGPPGSDPKAPQVWLQKQKHTISFIKVGTFIILKYNGEYEHIKAFNICKN